MVPGRAGKDNDPAPGLEKNPGKKGEVFSDKHPYYPQSCSTCPYSKNKLKALFADLTGRRDCDNCNTLKNILEETKNLNKYPPEREDYKKVSDGVYQSPWNRNEQEFKANTMIAKFIHKKIKESIWMLPCLDPNNKEQASLRNRLLPQGVFENKNPDYLILGLIFEFKSLLGLEQYDREHASEAIKNRIRKAKRQAKNVIIEVPAMVERETIHNAIKGHNNRSKNKGKIWIIWRNKLLMY